MTMSSAFLWARGLRKAAVILLAGAVHFAEGVGGTGAQKKAIVLSLLDRLVVALPLPFPLSTVTRVLAQVFGPLAVDWCVRRANEEGLLPKTQPAPTEPPSS